LSFGNKGKGREGKGREGVKGVKGEKGGFKVDKGEDTISMGIDVM
jgi:hypothetical protein